jgi:hypothetical protein
MHHDRNTVSLENIRVEFNWSVIEEKDRSNPEDPVKWPKDSHDKAINWLMNRD